MATIAGTGGAGALIGASAGVCIVAGKGTDTVDCGDAPAFYAFKPLTTVESGHVDDWVAAIVDGIGFNIHAGKGNDTISPDDVPAVAQMTAPDLRPVRIAKGALGENLPSSDLVVSPRHRVLVRSAIARRMFGATEVLVGAAQFPALDGVERDGMGDAGASDEGAGDAAYFHILFDRHEILLSNVAWAESPGPGAQALASADLAARRDILTLFPERRDGAVPASARPLIPGRKARRLVERHARHGRPLLDGRI